MHAGQYKPNSFTPVIGAMDLYEYVDMITSNPKRFQEYKETDRYNNDGTTTRMIIMRQDALVNRVREQAYRIFILTFTANEINLNKEPERKEERLNKQEQAIELCEEHLASIQLCRKHFHLTNKRIRYWGSMTLELRDAIKGWHKSDKTRYQNI